NHALLAVDLATGMRTLISNNNTPNDSNAFISPAGIVLDAANNRALILDSDSNRRALMAVDLATGERTILCDATTPNGEHPFSSPYGIALDSVNTRVLVTDLNLDAFLAVDLAAGARSAVSTPAPTFSARPCRAAST